MEGLLSTGPTPSSFNICINSPLLAFKFDCKATLKITYAISNVQNMHFKKSLCSFREQSNLCDVLNLDLFSHLGKGC